MSSDMYELMSVDVLNCSAKTCLAEISVWDCGDAHMVTIKYDHGAQRATPVTGPLTLSLAVCADKEVIAELREAIAVKRDELRAKN